jgi:aminoglycoside 6'-N-acetyltransferase I
MVEIRVLQSSEASALDNVADGVFDGPVNQRWSREFFADPRHHLAVAFDQNLVVGMASGVHYVHPDKAPELWINEVGVADSHQGQGIGRRLLAVLMDHARSLGCGEAWVLTGSDNIAAQRMYRAAGGEPEADRPVLFTFRLTTDRDAP